MDTPDPTLYGKEVETINRKTLNQSPGRQAHEKSGQIHIPSSSKILERLYNDNGIRVRMLRRGRPNKVPTVKELIDQLSRKQCDRLLDLEAKGSRVEKPCGYTGNVGSNRDSMMNTSSIRTMADSMRCASETPRRVAMDIALQEQLRCLSERPTRLEINMDYQPTTSRTDCTKPAG